MPSEPSSRTRIQPEPFPRLLAEAAGAGSGSPALSIELKIVLIYLAATRIGYMPASKLGVHVGPMPLFLTDIVLSLLIGVTLWRRPMAILRWASTGTGGGAIGTAVWLLLLLDFCYFAAAFKEYRMFAIRDFAIFGYSLFFPMVYFALRTREQVIRVILWFIYSGVILSLLVIFQALSGIDTGLLNQGIRLAFGHKVPFVGDDDVGAIAAFSMCGLFGYALFEVRSRSLNVACAFACLLALVATTTRSATLGAVLAVATTFTVADRRYRLLAGLLGLLMAGLVVAGNAFPTLPGGAVCQNFYAAMASGSAGQDDPTAEFRILRWHSIIGLWSHHPLLGVGFGVPILSSDLIIPGETQGLYNVGMPHNTYLFVLARMGLLGLCLIGFAWLTAILGLLRRSRIYHRAEDLALGNILVSMAGYAGFVLFFERPLYNAPFWIMCAAAARLLDFSPSVAAVPRRATQY
jgi:O-antigen ligase